MSYTWILLIYTLPSQPSKKRAYVWRELKKLGAVYLRDGVAALPRQDALEERILQVAQRVEEYEGTADVILAPTFVENSEQRLLTRFREEREAEYRELYHASVRFLRDVLHEVDADDFGFPGVDNLESELARLKRWQQQIEGRDYVGAPGAERVRELLTKCDTAFERFVGTAHERVDSSPSRTDDVFDRLGGVAAPPESTDDMYPM